MHTLAEETENLFSCVAPHICLEQVWMQHDFVIGDPLNEEIIQTAVWTKTAIGTKRLATDAPISYESSISDYSHISFRDNEIFFMLIIATVAITGHVSLM